MNNDTNLTDRRKNKRYKVDNGVFALLGQKTTKLGQVIDISQGGLSFFHKDSEKKTKEQTSIAIIFDKKKTEKNSIPFKFDVMIVSNKNINNKKNSFLTKKRCGIKFTNLTYYRETWLKDFIQNHVHTD